MEDLLKDVLKVSFNNDFTTSLILFNLALTLGLSFIVTHVYKKTHKGLSYSQSFVGSIILVSLIVTAAMMIIGNSIVSAFALLGAFSIIRFRTPVKDVKDVSFIFLALVIGMGVGTGNYLIAILTTLFLSLVVWGMHKTNFGSMRKYGYILTFTFDTKEGKDDAFKAVFDQFLSSQSLLHVNAVEKGHKLDFTFNINFKKGDQGGSFADALKNVNGVSNVDLLTAKNDIEY